MKTIFLLSTAGTSEVSPATGYIIGAVIALIIMGYLLYTLVKPEKF